METRSLGRTGLRVSPLGFGAGSIGGSDLTEDEAARLLHGIVDLGISLIDTARSYGQSEERIGRHLSHRRAAVVLSTKIGYGIPGLPDWTAECIRAGIESALARLRTDVIDIVHLHSCPLETLRRDDIIDTLCGAVDEGKVRIAAYSGENEPLEWAVDSGRFGTVQTSINLCDQRGIDTYVSAARAQGVGVIAKRPLANAPWSRTMRPGDDDAAAAYFDRFRAMGLDASDESWPDRALRFAAFAPGVDCTLAGSSRLEHVKSNVESIEKGPLPDNEVRELRQSFERHDEGWQGLI